EQRGIDTTDSTAPWLIAWSAHGDRDAEMRVAGLERGKLLAENEIARCSEAEDDVDLAWPTCLRKIPRRAHHRRDLHATANQDDACRLCPGEAEGSMRGLDLSLVTFSERIMQPARHQAMLLAFHRDLDPIAPRGGRRDGIGAFGRDVPRRDMERQKWTEQV